MPGFRADIVHTGLVKATLGEANQGGIEDLGRGDLGKVRAGLGT